MAIHKRKRNISYIRETGVSSPSYGDTSLQIHHHQPQLLSSTRGNSCPLLILTLTRSYTMDQHTTDNWIAVLGMHVACHGGGGVVDIKLLPPRGLHRRG